MTSSTSRRRFIGTIGAASAALMTGLRPSFGQDLAQLKGEGEIVVCTWGGTSTDQMHKSWFTAFNEATGINVTTTSRPDIAKLEVMEKVGNVEWDMIDTEGVQLALALKKGLLQPINYDLIYSIVPKEHLDPKVLTPYGIGSVAFSTVIAWNTELFGDQGPQNWAEWMDNTKFKGRRALYAQPRPSFEIALLAAGVPKDKIYPININDAFEALNSIRDKIDLWVEKTSQWSVLMQNGEVDLMGSSLVPTQSAKRETGLVDFTFNEAIVEQSYWTIPKSAKGADQAQKLIAWMMRPEGMLDFARAMPFGVANTAIYADIPEDISRQLPGYPANAERNIHINEEWWAENAEEVQLRWLDWLATA